MGSGYGGKYKNTYGYKEHIKNKTNSYVRESARPYGLSRTTIITSTPDSPAVDINIDSPSFIKTQKIHFIYESE